MRINTNLMAVNAGRIGRQNEEKSAKNIKKLSSGLKITGYSDDAAGGAISEKMRSQIRGLNQGSRNVQDGISLIQTAEGGLSEITNIIQRQRELMIQAIDDSKTPDDKACIQLEIDELTAEINRIAEETEFNNIPLLSVPSTPGSSTTPVWPPVPTTPISPVTPPAPTQTININSLLSGDSGAGWSFTGGVLSITGGGVFEIVGTGATTTNRIAVTGGSPDIILNNVNIATNADPALDMHGQTVNLWLEGSNSLTTPDEYRAAIETTDGALTIDGNGSLYAATTNAAFSVGAAIGACFDDNCGTITINGGTVTATGGQSAGIGGGHFGDGGTITINGGTVTATSVDCAGIGGGDFAQSGDITINGGTVTAIGGPAASGIGCAVYGSVGTITINGGYVTATGGQYAPGIGSSGSSTPGGTINITGGIVIPTGGDAYSAAIGGGGGLSAYTPSDGIDVSISGGLVQIPSGGWIGGGIDIATGIPAASAITDVTGGNLSITDPANNLHGGAWDGSSNSAYQVQIFINDTSYTFPTHREVSYTIGGKTIDAITDNNGDLFMYLPMSEDGSVGEMTIGGVTYEGTLSMSADHNNVLILTPTGQPTQPNTGLGELWIQSRANTGDGIYIDRYDCRTDSLYEDLFAPNTITVNINGVDTQVTLTKLVTEPFEDASASLVSLDAVLKKITEYRTNAGSQQNRLEFTMGSVDITAIALENAKSRITDVDMAKEMTNFTKNNILQQSSRAMQAQANAIPDSVLQLIR